MLLLTLLCKIINIAMRKPAYQNVIARFWQCHQYLFDINEGCLHKIVEE